VRRDSGFRDEGGRSERAPEDRPVREERADVRERTDERPVRVSEQIGPIGPVDLDRESARDIAATGPEPIDMLSAFDGRQTKPKPEEPVYVVSEFGRSAKPAAIGSRKGKHTRPRETKVHRPLGSSSEAGGETPPESTPRIATEGKIGMSGGIGPIDLELPDHRSEE